MDTAFTYSTATGVRNESRPTGALNHIENAVQIARLL